MNIIKNLTFYIAELKNLNHSPDSYKNKDIIKINETRLYIYVNLDKNELLGNQAYVVVIETA